VTARSSRRFSPARNRWIRILGVAFVMYVLAYMDRTNISMALSSMRDDLGLSRAAIGGAAGMFYWGYLVLQIPAGRLAGTWSAKRVIAVLLVFWSGISLTTAFVHTEWQLIANRLALGISEGGVLTCVIVLIRAWFTKAERARANTVFLLSLSVSPMIANPVSGAILGFASWRWMFAIEAIPGLIWGLVWWFAIEDNPRDAVWLDPAERQELLATLEAERRVIRPLQGHWLRALLHPVIILLTVYNFLALMAEWSVNFWLPSVLKDTGMSIGAAGLLGAVPYLLGSIAMILVAMNSDRTGERRWHLVLATGAAGVFLLAIPIAVGNIFALVCLLSLSVGAFMGRYGPFWTLPSEVLPPAVAGVGIGLINGAGNLGGTVGPYFFGVLRTEFGDFSLALAAAGACLVTSAAIALAIRGDHGARTTPATLGEPAS
jgi:MFS family permease